jgi:hypothetical protein
LFRYFGIAFFLFIFYYFRYGFPIEFGDLRLTVRFFANAKTTPCALASPLRQFARQQLVVNASTGSPIALLQSHLKTANGYLSTMVTPPAETTPHLEHVLPMMTASKKMELGCKCVTVIDREADAVLYLRQWNAADELFLIRCDDDRRVLCDGHDVFIREITESAVKSDRFNFSRDVVIN